MKTIQESVEKRGIKNWREVMGMRKEWLDYKVVSLETDTRF